MEMLYQETWINSSWQKIWGLPPKWVTCSTWLNQHCMTGKKAMQTMKHWTGARIGSNQNQNSPLCINYYSVVYWLPLRAVLFVSLITLFVHHNQRNKRQKLKLCLLSTSLDLAGFGKALSKGKAGISKGSNPLAPDLLLKKVSNLQSKKFNQTVEFKSKTTIIKNILKIWTKRRILTKILVSLSNPTTNL